MRLTLPLALFAAVVLAAYAPHPDARGARASAATDSSAWVNLQILPDSLTRDELTAIMRGFTDALGVRCGFCHVREDGEWDFPSDAKGHKEVARGMMRMTWQINEEILPAIDGLGEHGEVRVTCATCHRGQAHPPAPEADAPDDEPGGHEPGSHDHG